MSSGKPEKTILFLASNSPRRRELLALGGWEYVLLPVQVDETPIPGEDGTSYVSRLARDKVISAARHAGNNAVIIAADTTVIDTRDQGDEIILGKPRDHHEASMMLRSLRGHTHQVHTAISILATRNGTKLCDLCTTQVPMRDYTDAEIQAYVTSNDPMDKAGAYAIQNEVFHPVEKLDGCFANVMGLPICHLTVGLKRVGIGPEKDVAQACQSTLRYDCPVYTHILNERIPDYTCG